MRDSKFVTKAGPQKGSAAVGVNSDYKKGKDGEYIEDSFTIK